MCEKWYRRLTLWLVLVLLAVALVATGACGQTPPVVPTTETPEEPTEAPISTDTPEEPVMVDPTSTSWPDFNCDPSSEQNPCVVAEPETAWEPIRQSGPFKTTDGLTYVQNEVIVMGPRDLVRRALEDTLGGDAISERIFELEVQGLIPQSFFQRLPAQWPPDLWQDIVIGLYPTGNMDALEAVDLIEIWANDAGNFPDTAPGVTVFAETNRLIGHPHSVAGSPHSVAGSPLDVNGVGVPGAFWLQWALGPEGIELLDNSTAASNSRTIPDTGDGVQIAIFDSSPFTKEGSIAITWITPELTLQVSHVLADSTVPISPSDHGLFVSGLAHAVAPESEVHLLKVLGNDLTGNLATLIDAVGLYTDQRLKKNNNTLDNTVLNFSLGVLPDTKGAKCPLPNNPLAEPWAQAAAGDKAWWEDMCPLSFASLLSWADDRGAALVAASGNDAEHPWSKAEPPASYTFVLGVLASGRGGGQTCYTKQGDVAAPGGDPGPGNNCPPSVTMPDCPDGIVSLAYLTSPCTGYACWVGTSFAAPLVSGEVAAILSNCDSSIPAQDLHTMVGASQGGGNWSVINLPATFAKLTCPTPTPSP